MATNTNPANPQETEMTEKVQSLVNSVLREAEREATKIVEEAKKYREKTLEKACEDAEHIVREMLEKEKNELETLRRKRITKARLDAKHRYVAARDQIIEKTLEKTREKLREYVKTREYAKFLSELIVLSAIGMGGGKLRVTIAGTNHKNIVDPEKISRVVSEKTGRDTEIKLVTSEDSIGGVVVRTEDQKLELDNTFEARLERNMRKIRMELQKTLFSDVTRE